MLLLTRCNTQSWQGEVQGGAPAGAAELGEAELRELLRWFKHDFFAWVDKPSCEVQSASHLNPSHPPRHTHPPHPPHAPHAPHPPQLTNEPTEPLGMGVPTAEERAGGAARVELYRGPTGHITRFPRCHTTP